MTEHSDPLNSAAEAAGTSRFEIRRRALWWATILCDRPDTPDPWTPREDDDEAAASILRDIASALTASPAPATTDVVLATGGGGLVVLVHEARCSLAARAGGPLVVVCSDYPRGLVIHGGTALPQDPYGEAALDQTSGQSAADLIEILIGRSRRLQRTPTESDTL